MAQNITGEVIDAETRQTIPFANIYYSGKKLGVQADYDGQFTIPYQKGKLSVSCIGYETQQIAPNIGEHLIVRLTPSSSLSEVVVSGSKRTKYSRKENPAVDLMRQVIARKDNNDLRRHDYYSYNKYAKMVMALNEVSDSLFKDSRYKKSLSFMQDHVEVCEVTGKRILPLTVDEVLSRQIYRRKPHSEKTIVEGQQSTGINDLFSTGDMVTTMLSDCFTDINIYENNVRLLQHQFTSPLGGEAAIGFYRYFIEDTLMVAGKRCIHVSFTPNNALDFGFSGSLYILADSTYRVKRAEIGIPYNSSVNWVDRMDLVQEFKQLPSGEQAISSEDMIVQLRIINALPKFQVRRTIEYSNFSLAEIDDKEFKFNGDTYTEPNAAMRSEEYWNYYRPTELSSSENKMGNFLDNLMNIKGFKYFMFVLKAFIENYVETSVTPEHPSKVDIGPVNTMITSNHVNGLRLRIPVFTTANLHPHIFLKGYVAYGFKDDKWMGSGEVTYSFNEKEYLTREFPMNNLTFNFTRDVMAPSDRFLPTDKDNVFVSLKWTDVNHMMYYDSYSLLWDKEWNNGMRFTTQYKYEIDQPTGALFYQRLNYEGTPSPYSSDYVNKLHTSDLTLSFSYQPNAKWLNTKQRRIKANKDTPTYSASHTIGIKGFLGSDYTYNLTEVGLSKCFWLNSWGHIDMALKGGIQWNTVPYPLLILPAANLSYFMKDGTFSLIDNMEFPTDRYASLMLSWDLNGKIFNRIPLLKKLEWREFIGVNVLWGGLTDKNNPFLAQNAGKSELYYFPGSFNQDGTFTYLSKVLDRKTPYVEAIIGIHNIFKLVHIEYVHRLTYTSDPSTQRWGIRVDVAYKF